MHAGTDSMILCPMRGRALHDVNRSADSMPGFARQARRKIRLDHSRQAAMIGN
ncbi:hypothetical protein [Paraburkholderia sp. J94]|uniref:hypothetical protein n=1 Tax=Paraburkholderia sp. J94 TaxID=2805441 RepID=UPI002AB0AA5D|nr:hypothetical protein [Paraburkholderia sp. J94]